MEKSLQMRKQKALARARDRRRLAQGKLRPEEICLAGNVCRKSPLILRRIKISDHEVWGF